MKKKAVSIILFVLFMSLAACGKKETSDIPLQTTEERGSQNKEETKDESGADPIGIRGSDTMEAEEKTVWQHMIFLFLQMWSLSGWTCPQ